MSGGIEAPATAHGHIQLVPTPFADLVALHAAFPERYPHLLQSVARGTPRARYDILFAFPGATLSCDTNGVLRSNGHPVAAADFLSLFDEQWRTQSVATIAAPPSVEPPFTGGWFVFFGYELAAQIESVLGDLPRGGPLPVALATRFPAAVIRDHERERTYLVCEDAIAAERLPEMQRDIMALRMPFINKLEIIDIVEESPQRFLDGVARVLAYIRAGDVFQVNLSRAWRARLGAPAWPVDLYRRLCASNPAPFAGLATFPGYRAIVSSSPERLVEVRGRTLRTRPIAGTYPRGGSRDEDARLAQELLRHPKERAEHVMLIDLERNDLGRVCRPGSVRVAELMALETYRHVHHIVSEVRGELRAGVTPGAVLRAVFPGGTITGCPKVRGMQIIAELEQTARGAYTGSMGYINHDGSMDLNILIRTLVQDGMDIGLRAGAGIVADSIPERELDETRAKARGLLAALGAA